jgi:hypothetical protein
MSQAAAGGKTLRGVLITAGVSRAAATRRAADETGLSYFGYRYYDARQGEWISVDPILDEMLDVGKLAPGDGLRDIAARLGCRACG